MSKIKKDLTKEQKAFLQSIKGKTISISIKVGAGKNII